MSDEQTLVTDRPNKIRVQNGMYIVRTQAGFNAAIKEMYDDFKEMRVYGYPKSYPSLVTISMGYDGGEFIQCKSIHLDKLKPYIND